VSVVYCSPCPLSLSSFIDWALLVLEPIPSAFVKFYRLLISVVIFMVGKYFKKIKFFLIFFLFFYIYIENIKKNIIFKKYNIIFLFKCYCYYINKKIRVDHHSNLNEINKKKNLATTMIFSY
jgi:hypothetical protein